MNDDGDSSVSTLNSLIGDHGNALQSSCPSETACSKVIHQLESITESKRPVGVKISDE